MDGVTQDAYRTISDLAALCRITITPEEAACIAQEMDLGSSELKAIGDIFSYLAKRRHDATIETFLRLSRLPRKVPKTFENFDFGRIQGKDAKALAALPSLSALFARRNVAFIGPQGVGKTHLAQAFGRACCLEGFKAYYLKATELKDRLARALATSNVAKTVNLLVKPSCLIIDEVGRCVFDRAETNLIFDVVDRRYEKEGPNTLVLTSNTAPSAWADFFTGDDALLCALERIFDRASVFIMRGASYRGGDCETFSVESAPQVLKTMP